MNANDLMTAAYINRIATAVPPNDIHQKFVAYAPALLKERDRQLFNRLAQRCQIEHRYSVFAPHADPTKLDADGYFENLPDTASRMRGYKSHAFGLAQTALDRLDLNDIGSQITHLIVTSCTGFYAPGIDMQIIAHYGLATSVERSIIGFMGCYAGITALKQARHIVRSQPAAKVLIVNIELCTLHLQNGNDVEQMLSFMIFADGCAASLISAEPDGIEIQSFHSLLIPDSSEHITWHIGEHGFDMHLSGKIPQVLASSLRQKLPEIVQGTSANIEHWAIHPGGRTVLDAVEDAAGLTPEKLYPSRSVLRNYGNMSSATVMFVLKDMMQRKYTGAGCAMAFGPGMAAETMRFHLHVPV